MRRTKPLIAGHAGHCLAMLAALCCAGLARADSQSATGSSSNPPSVSVQLRFSISIGKYLSLRVGDLGGSVSSVNFTVGFDPELPNRNSQALSGGRPGMVTRVATSNPATTAGTLAVSAFTNSAGTVLTCSLSALAGGTPLAVGASANGIPGRNDVAVVASSSGGGAAMVAHPGGHLGGCNGSTSTSVPMMKTLNGSFTYSTTFAPDAVRAGVYGNVVTYAATTL